MATPSQSTLATALQSATIKFKDSPSKVTIAPSGIWGGVNFQGQLVVNLFVDSPDYPDSINLKFNQAVNSVTEQVNVAPGDIKIVREILATLVLTPASAEVIGTWLVQNAKQIKVQVEAAKGPATVQTSINR